MSKTDDVTCVREHTRAQTLGELSVRRSCQRLDEPDLGSRRSHRYRLDDGSRAGAERGRASQHGVADRLRDLVGVAGKHFGHEERVPGCHAIEIAGIGAVRLGELRNSSVRERLEAQAPDGGDSRKTSEDDAERVRGIELVVAIGRDHERGGVLDSSSDEPKDVERRLVGPVHVLEDEDGRSRMRAPP